MPGLKTYLKLVKHGLGELISKKEPTMLEVGANAPDFEVEAHDGSTVRLSDYRGKKVILWFYPKADTPGWTIQGNGFRDRIRDFEQHNVQILGASFDTVEENKAFAEKFGYTFPLLCDTEKKVGKLYGAADSDFAARISYVIDENGKISHALPSVNVKSHTDDVLAMVR